MEAVPSDFEHSCTIHDIFESSHCPFLVDIAGLTITVGRIGDLILRCEK